MSITSLILPPHHNFTNFTLFTIFTEITDPTGELVCQDQDGKIFMLKTSTNWRFASDIIDSIDTLTNCPLSLPWRRSMLSMEALTKHGQMLTTQARCH